MYKSIAIPLSVSALALSAFSADEPIIVDHSCTDLVAIPPAWIDAAKSSLHIAYGHTSHGSQVTSGMTGLVDFTGGIGGPQYAWNDGGTGGALDLHDYAMAGDVGYYPQWVDNTRDYLDDPANADVNVIMWAWCGQVSSYTQQDMIDRYLAPMTQLELDYPDVMFVYMTGHLDYWAMTNTNARNQQIRDYCLANDKILYDFAHIESFNPDGVFHEFANDDCSFWDAGGTLQGNWATNWQNSHTEDVDWYHCSSPHSQPLNANQKAYAAWWLWARLAGWSGDNSIGTPYCLPGANGATIRAFGDTSIAANDLLLVATGVPTKEFGMFYYGDNQVQLPFGQGFRCVGGSQGVCRLEPVINSGTAGVLEFQVDLANPPMIKCTVLPGSTWHYQTWFRDGMSHDLSDAVSITFIP